MAKENIWSRILNMPSKIFQAGLIIVVIFFLFIPSVFPITVSKPTQDYFDYVENLPEGSVFVYDCSIVLQTRTYMEQADIMVLDHLYAKPGIKILAVSFTSPGTINWELMLRIMPASVRAKKTYGEDVVYLGYIAGEETAVAAFCSNIRGVSTTDYYGNSLDSLPMMTTGHPVTGGPINDATAYTVATFYNWNSAMIQAYARVFGDTWGVPLVFPNLMSQRFSSVAPYIPDYIIHYFFQERMEEFEYLLGVNYGITGINMMFYVTRNWVSLGFFCLIIVTQFIDYMNERTKRAEVVVK